jgi:hypothetical protein
VEPSILEADARARNDVPHRAGHEHLAWAGERRDPRAGMNCDPADAIAVELALAGMQSGQQLKPELSGPIPYGERARDSKGRRAEGCEEPVPGHVDLSPSEPSQLLAETGLMPFDQPAPPPVAELDHLARGSDDVGEQDGGQDATTEGRHVLEPRRIPVPLVHVEPFPSLHPLRDGRCHCR